jgi:hypothetical protein
MTDPNLRPATPDEESDSGDTGRTVRVELTIVLSDDDEREFHESLAVHGWANKLDLGLDSTVTTRFLPSPDTGTLTPAERKHIEVYNGYGVPVDWFVGHRRDNGDVEVLAVGHDRDDEEGRGFVWSLLINGDECNTTEAPLGPFETGINI